MSKEAEDLLIAWRKSFGEREHYGSGSTRQAMYDFADKLIAEREPKIMNEHDLRRICVSNAHDEWKLIHKYFLANIAAVLDRKLAQKHDSYLKQDGQGNITYHSDMNGIAIARRIVADALKVSS